MSPRGTRIFVTRKLWEAKARSLLRWGRRTKSSGATLEPIRPRRDDQSPMGASDCLSEPRFLRRERGRVATRRPRSQGTKAPRSSAARSGSTGSSSSAPDFWRPRLRGRWQIRRCRNREDIARAKAARGDLPTPFCDLDTHEVGAHRVSDRALDGRWIQVPSPSMSDQWKIGVSGTIPATRSAFWAPRIAPSAPCPLIDGASIGKPFCTRGRNTWTSRSCPNSESLLCDSSPER